MDNLTHSLVGLTLAKAGLERASPYATTVCLISANAADMDFITLFFGDRWTLLQQHRGITHSIVGTIGIGLLVPLFVFSIERLVARLKRRRPSIRWRGLLIVSCIAAATHPLMDWTNNYGVRPLLPWSGRWFYGDLVFIVDPYIWLILGAVAFLLTSSRRLTIGAWCVLAMITTTLIVAASVRGGADTSALAIARSIWIVAVTIVVALRVVGAQRRVGAGLARFALLIVIVYWGGLAVAHAFAYRKAVQTTSQLATARGETVLRLAAMPMLATPFSWQSVGETDRAMYRFVVDLNNRGLVESTTAVGRFEKPIGEGAQLVAIAERDRRAQTLLGFARFPLASVSSGDCIGQMFVQFADLRYTEPGTARGNFSVNIPIECPAH